MSAILREEVSTPGKSPSKLRAAMVLTLAGVLMGLIMAASWTPESQMTKLSWVPKWVAILADRAPNLRTAVPFVPLAFLLVLGFTDQNIRWPVTGAVLTSGTCLLLSEFGQRFLPHRTADVKDLMWGGVGIVIGTSLAWGLRSLIHLAHPVPPEANVDC